jgi:hypothetical protein
MVALAILRMQIILRRRVGNIIFWKLLKEIEKGSIALELISSGDFVFSGITVMLLRWRLSIIIDYH